MRNIFYNHFDCELFGTGHPRPAGDTRSAFEQERDRVIYSPAFRRLQSKTQVFVAGEYDFYRTRLTHSIEVSQIGRSICNCINKSNLLPEDNYIDPNLVEAICLSHDIGHPSFGHAGERSLNDLMKEYGGFEGNAQTLRIISEIFYYNNNKFTGLKPTRAFMDGIMKYKVLFSNSKDKSNHFLYDYQDEHVNFIFGDTDYKEQIPNLNNIKSIECQIMDWADDIAYCISDLIDGIRAKFINLKNLLDYFSSNICLEIKERKIIAELIKNVKRDQYERYLNWLIGLLIKSTRIEKDENFMSEISNRYCFRIAISDEAKLYCKTLKKISRSLVFNTPQIHQIEFKGTEIINKLFRVFYENCVACDCGLIIMPSHYLIQMKKMDRLGKARFLCDYLSGMTDDFIVRTYKRLFDPDFGSIVDLV